MTKAAGKYQLSTALGVLRRSRIRALLVSLFLALQCGLVFHQMEHGLHFDLIAGSDECALCQATANLIPAPEPTIIIAPVAVAYVHPIPASDKASTQLWPATGFRPRAPPIFFS